MDGYGRHTTSTRCVTRCPTGFILDSASRVCMMENQDFSTPVPLDFSDSPHPPTMIPDRGLFFDGHSALKLSDFELNRDHQFNLWIRLFDFDVTILSLRNIPTWTGYPEFNESSNSDRWDLAVDSDFYYEISLNSEHKFKLTTPYFTTDSSV